MCPRQLRPNQVNVLEAHVAAVNLEERVAVVRLRLGVVWLVCRAQYWPAREVPALAHDLHVRVHNQRALLRAALEIPVDVPWDHDPSGEGRGQHLAQLIRVADLDVAGGELRDRYSPSGRTRLIRVHRGAGYGRREREHQARCAHAQAAPSEHALYTSRESHWA